MMQAINVDGAVQQHPVAAFLDEFSLEITAKHVDKIAEIAARLRPGTHTYVAMIDPVDFSEMLRAAKALRDHGLEPVPHIPARFVKDKATLESWIAAYAQEAGVNHALVLGGGAPQPIGEFHSAMGLLETGLFEKYQITKLGFAGHPEGNPEIEKSVGKDGLLGALREKQEFAAGMGAEAYIATQFLFEAAPVATWAEHLRQNDISMPINVGVPGPATLKTLVRYASVCGVGASARLIRKQARNVTKLMSVNKPDGFVAGLADFHFSRPELGIKRAHLYPFGGFDKLLDWVDETRQG